MIVENIRPEQYEELLIVWENSVRATHDFITEEDIGFFKPIILEQAFPAVILKCIKGKHGEILGFVGVNENKVEMLFVSDDARGQSVGKKLLQFAIEQLDATQVDVNEQNPLAVGFYKHMGFTVVYRSPLDDMGKPFPILHMVLYSVDSYTQIYQKKRPRLITLGASIFGVRILNSRFTLMLASKNTLMTIMVLA